MAGLIKAWSYSRYSDYDKCPQLAKFKHVDKLQVEENDAMRGGKEAHEDAAAFIRGDHPGGEALRGWLHFGDLFTQLRELEPLVEQQLGFTAQWKPTGWFSRDTWFRSILDVCKVYEDNTADIVDHKTGKPYASHAEQAELYAISVFIRYPNVQRAAVRFWYLDHGTESVFRFARSDAPDIIARWTKKTKRMLNDTIMAPKPGEHCKWCDFAKSKGGPCKYG